jgi:hypothetical protein
MAFHVPEKYRVRIGAFRSDASSGNNGQFLLPAPKFKTTIMVQASEGLGWEHVSVSTGSRTPSWSEMCAVKALFWDADDCVVQYHPPASEYVNNHPYCLHLWRPINGRILMPPSILVGIKNV